MTISVRTSVNGAPAVAGSVTIVAGDTVDLSLESYSGVRVIEWEIFAYPEGWTPPAGWTAGSGRYFWNGSSGTSLTPPQLDFTGAPWGKWLFRATINYGLGAGGASDLRATRDDTVGAEILGPGGLEDPAVGEEQQFDDWRQQVGSIQGNFRKLATGAHSVLAFGADPTGATDSTAAIQAALTAGAGAEVVVPTGLYTISAALTIPTGTTFRGIGRAVIRLADGSNSHVLRVADNATDVEIIELELDGNKAGNPTGGHGITTGGDGSRYRVIDCDIHDCMSDGIRWIGTTTVTDIIVRGTRCYDNGIAGFNGQNLAYMTISGCEAWGNATHGIGWLGVGAYVTVTGCVSRDNGVGATAADNFTGYADGNHHITVTGNVSVGGGNNGIHISGNHITVTGNVVTSAPAHGIQMNAEGAAVSDTCVIAGNTIEGCARAGIRLEDCANFAVSGNAVTGCTAHGIWAGTSTGGTIGHNTVRGNGADGIRLDTCVSVAVTGNASVGNTSDGIQIVAATYCTVTGNRCEGNATPFVESGASDFNMISGNNLLGNTSNTCATVGASSAWGKNINGGSPNVASAATITLPHYTNYIVVTGTTDITTITTAPRDRLVTLRFAGILTVTDGSNLKLNGNLVTSSATTLTLQSDGAYWWEIARAAN